MNTRRGDTAVYPIYYTPKEAAEVCRVDRRTIYNWVRSGKLPAVKRGGVWNIPAIWLGGRIRNDYI